MYSNVFRKYCIVFSPPESRIHAAMTGNMFLFTDVQAMQVNVSASEGLVIPVSISSPSVSLPQDLITEQREDTGLLLCSKCRQRKDGCTVRLWASSVCRCASSSCCHCVEKTESVPAKLIHNQTLVQNEKCPATQNTLVTEIC